MAKSKRGPALIELIHKQETPPLRRPGAPVAGVANVDSGPPVLQPEAEPIVPAFREAFDTAEPDPMPFAAIRGDRVVLSFSSVSAGVVAFVLIAAVGTSFLAGQRSGEKEGLSTGFVQGVESVRAGAMGEIEAARRSPPNPDVFAGMASNPLKGESKTREKAAPPAVSEPKTTAPRQPSTESPWVAGHTYIVVQDFKSEDVADVEAAQQFLKDHGIETAVLESKGAYKYRLLAIKGFNREDAVQKQWCDEYHDRIKELGKLFVKAGGRYDLQGYQKKVTGPGW